MARQARPLKCSFLLISERPQQAQVLRVGSMGNVENIPDYWYCAQNQVDENVPAHPQNETERRTLTHGSEDER